MALFAATTIILEYINKVCVCVLYVRVRMCAYVYACTCIHACLVCLQQNKPYSVINIFDNLHGIVKRPLVQKILDTLSEKCVLTGRGWGSMGLACAACWFFLFVFLQGPHQREGVWQSQAVLP